MIIDAHAHIFSHACPRVSDSSFPVERLLALMDADGVHGAVIVQNPVIGIINEEVREALASFPDRFAGVIQVDPGAPDTLQTIRAFLSKRQQTLKLEMSQEWGWTGVHPRLRLDGPELRDVWTFIADAGMNVIIDPGAIGNPGYQVEEIDHLSDCHSGIRFLVEHLGYLQPADPPRPQR